MRTLLALLLGALFLLGCQAQEERKPPPPKPEQKTGFIEEAAFDEPVAVAGGDDVFLVAERGGRIYRLEAGQKILWADVSSRLGEGGLGGIAVSPDWDVDGLFYVFMENRGGAKVLFEGATESNLGTVRRTVMRIEDPLALPGPVTWLDDSLVLSVRGEAAKSSWAGSLLRIKPYLGNGESYEIVSTNNEQEVWMRGFENVTSLSGQGSDIWISDGEKLLRANSQKKYKSAKTIPLVKEIPCLLGGAPRDKEFLYVCQKGVFAWPSGDTISSERGIQSLWSASGEIWALSKDKLYRLEEG